MTIALPSVAVSTAPTVVKTFFQHYITQMKKDKEDRRTEGEWERNANPLSQLRKFVINPFLFFYLLIPATDEFMFHEAFAIVKRFIEIATRDTAESLQRFTNTRVPNPPGATSLRLLIPMTSCNQAAACLIEYFGEEELKTVVGGSRWWQVRGLKGVQGEWIAMKDDWKRAQRVEEREAEDGNDEYLKKRAKELNLNRRHERKKSHTSIPKLGRNKSSKSNKSFKDQLSEQNGQAKPRESTGGRSELDEGRDEPPETFEELDRLKRVMYYIHGGGYYFGSISTHRLMISRFARKFGGRAFAVNYRKAPQWPWPCPVQDVLAGYLYLIDPPPEARHRAIDPAHIVIAGDSAGGGLALALLGVLRDLNKPMPSGAVLLSPWCDLTHSFPSILQNTDTDIIPRYSFIHKPSTLWPVPGVRPEDKQKTATRKKANGKEKNNDASDPPDTNRASGLFHKEHQQEPEMAVLHGVEKDVTKQKADGEIGQSEKDHLAVRKKEIHQEESIAAPPPKKKNSNHLTNSTVPRPLDHLYAEPIKVPIKEPGKEEEDIELRQQIQLYATNAQLYHPLCSPILQGSLGGLPPLYILAGDSEVLRDEIIYLAHRAARPEQYQLKKELLENSERCRQDAQRFNSQPTKVHLQVYDGQPHVLTLFSFTTSARFAYRAIASFVKHVTGAPTNVINPFPHLENSSSLDRPNSDAPSNPRTHKTMVSNTSSEHHQTSNGKPIVAPIDTEHLMKQIDTPEMMSPETAESSSSHLQESNNTPTPVDAPIKGDSLRQKKRRDVTLGIKNDYDGQVPLRRPTYVQEMIRERVDIRGQLRPLEEEHLLQALQVPIDDIGRIKHGPVKRYLTGQELWDKKFKRTAKKVDRERAKNEAKAYAMLEQAAREGLLDEEQMAKAAKEAKEKKNGNHQQDETWFDDGWADLASFGPLDLLGEVPPPSAVAGRRDTPDALELIRQSLHMRAYRLRAGEEAAEVGAKVSYGTDRVGKGAKSKVKARHFTGAKWKQSVAERQVETKGNYGLQAWGGAMNYFTGKSNEKSKKDGLKQKHRHQQKDPPQSSSETNVSNAAIVSAAEWEDAPSSTDNLQQ